VSSKISHVAERRNHSTNRLGNTIFQLGQISKLVFVNPVTDELDSKIRKLNKEYSETNSSILYFQQVPKFIIELTLLFLICSGLFYVNLQSDPSRLLGPFVFLSGSVIRLIPSLLRFQTSLLFVRQSYGIAKPLIKQVANLSRSTDSFINQQIENSSNLVISAKGLAFRYPNNPAALFHDLDIDIPKGKLVCITGPSGQGKTTLIDILMGIHIPTSGVVTHFSSPINSLRICYMPQETFLVDGDLYANIALGTKKELVRTDLVDKLIHIFGLREFSERLETQNATGDLFSRIVVSGGERQRIGICRALYTDPNVVFLDEATNALDLELEGMIIDNVRESFPNLTIVAISHGGSVLKSADITYMLSGGELHVD
jgi:ATP-binding cassette subfamily C protein